jgi:VWFA-related protein
MSTRHLFLASAIAASVLTMSVRAQQPTFHTNTDLVPVYVSVRAGRTAVAGLGPADFTLTDRGVEQTIDAVSSETVPIDVTLVVDTSASVITSLDRFRADVRAIVAALHPEEQIRLVTFDTDVRQILPMQPPSAKPPVSEMRLGDRTALVDAIALAMSRARRPDRRHLIFVFTDGFDTASVLDYGALPELAGRIDGLLHIVLVKSGDAADDTAAPRFDALAAAARRTGGSLYPPGSTDVDIVSAFDEAIDAFRHSYVVYFTPTGVAREGWHDITVHLKKPGAYLVRAREGYYGQ